MDKKKLIKQYIGAIILLIVSFLLMRAMYKDNERADQAAATEIVTEQAGQTDTQQEE